MRIDLVAVGTRVPGWVTAGYDDYARRLPPECRLRLHEIAPGRRRRNQPSTAAVADEGRRMLAAVPARAQAIALDVSGKSWSTTDLAEQLGLWLAAGTGVALLVGGPDGLAGDCLARAHTRWSLSPLTLPHALVRVLVAETLYRAWSLRAGHPYHR